jgi:hypothetical protein
MTRLISLCFTRLKQNNIIIIAYYYVRFTVSKCIHKPVKQAKQPIPFLNFLRTECNPQTRQIGGVKWVNS